MSKLDLEQLKSQYVGQSFGWLTVIDVTRNNSTIMFVCKCKCGNVTSTKKNSVISGHTTSCGCYKRSKEKGAKYSEWCKNNPERVKEIADNYKKTIRDNPNILIERGRKQSKLYKDNPEIIEKISESNKKFWKDNPDKSVERSKHRAERLNDHPEIQLQINQKLRDYYADNPDAKKLISDKLSELYNSDYYRNLFHDAQIEWCKNNPDLLAERGRKQSELYKSNPEVLKQISDSSKEYWSLHPEEALARGAKCSEWCKNNRQIKLKLNTEVSAFYKERRINSDFVTLLEIIHPDYIEPLLSGDIKSTDIILTKCPMCGTYDKHTLSNVYHISNGQLKLGHAPLCNNCRSRLVSSSYENEIADYISTFYNGELIRNSRETISPLELDLFYPEKKIAVEFNGDYWHDENHKSSDYHYNKFLQCREKKVLLVSIFESDWNNKKEEIKEYIKDSFNGKENELSFNEDHSLMNNNYPSICHFLIVDSYIEDIYYNNTYKVYTCGYSKIVK